MELNSFKTIYLIRHCKAEGQEPSANLTIGGFKQSSLLADFLYPKQIDYIISSTYQRAISTIEPLAQLINLDVNTDERLCERVLSSEDFSDWQEKLCKTFHDHEISFPGGETSIEAMRRGISVIEELLTLPKKHIAAVTHGNLLCLILGYFDAKYGFTQWECLTNPDVFELIIPDNKKAVRIERVWQ